MRKEEGFCTQKGGAHKGGEEKGAGVCTSTTKKKKKRNVLGQSPGKKAL